MITAQLAKIAFEAYKESAKGVNFAGQPIPEWKEMPDAIRKHWFAAAEAQRQAMLDALSLDERETLSLRHALHFSKNFSSAGVPGTTQFLLLAKLASVLGFR